MKPFLWALLLVAACGGKVVFDPAGSGGAGGSTSSTSSTSTSTSTSATSTTTLDGPCEELCPTLAQRGCVGNVGDCVQRCHDAPQPSCEAESTAELSCILSHLGDGPGCFFSACEVEMTAYQVCVAAPGCGGPPVAGSGDPGTCVGKGICGSVELSATCDATGFCQCFEDTTMVGTCHETGPFLCDFFHGCCRSFWPQGE